MHFIRGKVADVYPAPDERRARWCCRSRTRCSARCARSRWTWWSWRWGWSRSADAEDVRRAVQHHLRAATASSWRGTPSWRRSTPSPTASGSPGRCQGPKDIPDTVAQAGAAAGEALSLIDAGHVELEPNTAYIVEEDCSGCKTCIPMCPYKAIAVDAETEKARDQRGALQGLRDLRGRSARRARRGRTSSRTTRSTRRSRECWPMSETTQGTAAAAGSSSRRSSPSSATGAPTWPPTWPARRGIKLRPRTSAWCGRCARGASTRSSCSTRSRRAPTAC